MKNSKIINNKQYAPFKFFTRTMMRIDYVNEIWVGMGLPIRTWLITIPNLPFLFIYFFHLNSLPQCVYIYKLILIQISIIFPTLIKYEEDDKNDGIYNFLIRWTCHLKP